MVITVLLIQSYSVAERSCEPNRICVYPEDFLKYETITDDGNKSTKIHEFGELLPNDRISVITKTVWDAGENEEIKYSLDLKKGTTDEFPDEEFPFVDMVTVPIVEDKTITDPNVIVEEKSITFSGIKRTIIVAKATSDDDQGSGSIELAYDKQTGVLVYMISKITTESKLGTISLGGKTNLVDTNIFTSIPSPPINKKSIPDWIRNNAKWWSSDQIGDSDFISGIQFLIKERIMPIPETTVKSDNTSNEIPRWIKNNAEWWSQGVITDDDFIKGIQYLVTNGIIKI